jgi:hypothetical protein
MKCNTLYGCLLSVKKVKYFHYKNMSNVWHINPLNAQLNPTCHLLALLGAHHVLTLAGKGLIYK